MDKLESEDADGDERSIELCSLRSIYPELEILPPKSNCLHARLEILVDPASPIHLPLHRNLSHLPPLALDFFLAPEYPQLKPPGVKVCDSVGWLDQRTLDRWQSHAQILWEECGRDQILYAYVDYLQDQASRIDGVDVAAELQISLVDYDAREKQRRFEQQTFDCGVCLGECLSFDVAFNGSQCHRMSRCEHVFCVSCLQDFFHASIADGDIVNVKCLAPKCALTDPLLDSSELLQIPLDQSAVQRYVKLQRKRKFESNKYTVYCPRSWCQGPAQAKLPELGREDGLPTLPKPGDRLAICEDCKLAFCLVCKASWHGEYFSCFPRSQFELTAEERASEDYLKLHTQPCPTCDARAQKTHGCNHMICFKCETHFCYLCGAYLEKGNPYEHFNNRSKGCYMRLWELEEGEDGAAGHAWAGGVQEPPLEPDLPNVAEEALHRFLHLAIDETLD